MSAELGPDHPLDAGAFSSWVVQLRGALRGEHGSEVPCGSCTACCTSSQFVHIAPDEADTLAHIPADLLFPAPGLPRGNVLLGFDERGHCPLLVDGACSVYEHRPRTCRTYDCRVFPAAGLDLADDDSEGAKHGIAEQARRWRFATPTSDDRIRLGAVRAAASYVAEHESEWPAGTVPSTMTQRAVLAIELHEAFVARDETSDPVVAAPDPEVVHAELVRLRGSQ